MDILIWVVNSLPMTFSLDWFNLFLAMLHSFDGPTVVVQL